MTMRDDRLADAMPCPGCGRSLPTRVLADSMSLVTVGVCPQDGTQQLSRVQLSFEPEAAAPRAYEMAELPRSYKPGGQCGLRLDQHQWCRLPVEHPGQHAA